MKVTCETCVHYRPSRPLSQLLARDLGTAEPQVMSELIKIMQDERELQDAEWAQKIELLRLDEPDLAWRSQPQMSSCCGVDEARGVYRFHELLNAEGDCELYEPSHAAPCRTCSHLREGRGEAEDQAQFARLGRLAADAAALQQSPGDLIAKLVEQIGATKAFEAVQAYYARRTAFRPPRYLPVCGALSTAEEFVPSCVANRHDRCPLHSAAPAGASTSMLEGLQGYLNVFSTEPK